MGNCISFSDKLKMAKFILTNNRFSNGERVKQFEREWNEWLGSSYSLFVSSGSTANFLLLAAIIEKYNLKRGDKVLVSSCTWMTNISPIIQLGLVPVFCDIDLHDFSFKEEDLEYISKNYDIKLIFVTHILGFVSDQEKIEKYFPKTLIIDDACETMGGRDSSGHKLGSNLFGFRDGYNSLGTTFSTYIGHHFSSVEGGIVSTYDEDLYDLMKMKRSHGLARESKSFNYYKFAYQALDSQFLFITDGYNFRNTEIGAVLASSQLKRLDNFIRIRNENFKEFSKLTQFYFDKVYPYNYKQTNSYFAFPIICRNETTFKKIKNLLSENNIEFRPIISGNIVKQPFLQRLNYKIGYKKSFYDVNIIHNLGVYIGNNQFINKKHIKYLEEKIFSKL